MRALNSAFIPMMITAQIIRQIKFLCKHFFNPSNSACRQTAIENAQKLGTASFKPPQSYKILSGHDFLLNTLITVFRLSTILLDFYKCILSGAIKFVSVRSFQGSLTLFEITRAYYESETFSDFSLHCIFESENFRFPFLYEKQANLGK